MIQKNFFIIFSLILMIGLASSANIIIRDGRIISEDEISATSFIGDGTDLTNVPGPWNITGGDIFYNLGKVGIGTIQPLSPFHVTTSIDSIIAIFNSSLSGSVDFYSGESSDVKLRFFSGSNGLWELISRGNSGNFEIYDSNDSVSRIVIEDEGNIGIGTNDPNSTLEVNGTIKATKFIGDGSLLTGTGGSSSLPVGVIIPWYKHASVTLNGEFVECNGQILNNPDSIFHNTVIPNLNEENRYLRGASSAGGTGGSATHQHSSPISFNYGSIYYDRDGDQFGEEGMLDTSTDYNRRIESGGDSSNNYGNMLTSSENSEPPYFEVVMIMKIK